MEVPYCMRIVRKPPNRSVVAGDDGVERFYVCATCSKPLKGGRVPDGCLARLDPGDVPLDTLGQPMPRLRNIECIIVSCARTIMRVYVLRLESTARWRTADTLPIAIRGHSISYPNASPEELLKLLPRDPDKLAQHMAVIFVDAVTSRAHLEAMVRKATCLMVCGWSVAKWAERAASVNRSIKLDPAVMRKYYAMGTERAVPESLVAAAVGTAEADYAQVLRSTFQHGREGNAAVRQQQDIIEGKLAALGGGFPPFGSAAVAAAPFTVGVAPPPTDLQRGGLGRRRPWYRSSPVQQVLRAAVPRPAGASTSVTSAPFAPEPPRYTLDGSTRVVLLHRSAQLSTGGEALGAATRVDNEVVALDASSGRAWAARVVAGTTGGSQAPPAVREEERRQKGQRQEGQQQKGAGDADVVFHDTEATRAQMDAMMAYLINDLGFAVLDVPAVDNTCSLTAAYAQLPGSLLPMWPAPAVQDAWCSILRGLRARLARRVRARAATDAAFMCMLRGMYDAGENLSDADVCALHLSGLAGVAALTFVDLAVLQEDFTALNAVLWIHRPNSTPLRLAQDAALPRPSTVHHIHLVQVWYGYWSVERAGTDHGPLNHFMAAVSPKDVDGYARRDRCPPPVTGGIFPTPTVCGGAVVTGSAQELAGRLAAAEEDGGADEVVDQGDEALAAAIQASLWTAGEGSACEAAAFQAAAEGARAATGAVDQDDAALAAAIQASLVTAGAEDLQDAAAVPEVAVVRPVRRLNGREEEAAAVEAAMLASLQPAGGGQVSERTPRTPGPAIDTGVCAPSSDPVTPAAVVRPARVAADVFGPPKLACTVDLLDSSSDVEEVKTVDAPTVARAQPYADVDLAETDTDEDAPTVVKVLPPNEDWLDAPDDARRLCAASREGCEPGTVRILGAFGPFAVPTSAFASFLSVMDSTRDPCELPIRHSTVPELEKLPRWQLTCLWFGRPLADEVMNACVLLLRHRQEVRLALPPPAAGPELPSYTLLTTFLYSRLLQRGVFTYDNVRRWVKQRTGVTILDRPLIGIPLHGSFHWVLVVLDLRARALRYYDSFAGDGVAMLRNLYRWIQRVVAALPVQAARWGLTPSTVWKAEVMRVPQQGGTLECGMFTLSTAIALTAGGPVNARLSAMNRLRVQLSDYLLTSEIPLEAGAAPNLYGAAGAPVQSLVTLVPDNPADVAADVLRPGAGVAPVAVPGGLTKAAGGPVPSTVEPPITPVAAAAVLPRSVRPGVVAPTVPGGHAVDTPRTVLCAPAHRLATATLGNAGAVPAVPAALPVTTAGRASCALEPVPAVIPVGATPCSRVFLVPASTLAASPETKGHAAAPLPTAARPRAGVPVPPSVPPPVTRSPAVAAAAPIPAGAPFCAGAPFSPAVPPVAPPPCSAPPPPKQHCGAYGCEADYAAAATGEPACVRGLEDGVTAPAEEGDMEGLDDIEVHYGGPEYVANPLSDPKATAEAVEREVVQTPGLFVFAAGGRNVKPLDEYQAGYIQGCHLDVFPFGEGASPEGMAFATLVKRLVKRYPSSQFGGNSFFLAHAFEVLNRQRMNLLTWVSCNISPGVLRGASRFPPDIIHAVATVLAAKGSDPTRKRLMAKAGQPAREIADGTSRSTARVDGTPAFYKGMASKTNAVAIALGPMSVFYNINPSDMYAGATAVAAGEEVTYEPASGRPVNLPSVVQLWRRVAQNPRACAELLVVTRRAIDWVIFGFKDGATKQSNPHCFAGRVLHLLNKVEQSLRLALHMHGGAHCLAFCVERLKQLFVGPNCAVLALAYSIISMWLPAPYKSPPKIPYAFGLADADAVDASELDRMVPAAAYDFVHIASIGGPGSKERLDACRDHLVRVVRTTLDHLCSSTCIRGGHLGGPDDCGMIYPRTLREWLRWLGLDGLFVAPRLGTHIVPHLPGLAMATGCNQSMSLICEVDRDYTAAVAEYFDTPEAERGPCPLGTADEHARDASGYATKYVTKEQPAGENSRFLRAAEKLDAYLDQAAPEQVNLSPKDSMRNLRVMGHATMACQSNGLAMATFILSGYSTCTLSLETVALVHAPFAALARDGTADEEPAACKLVEDATSGQFSVVTSLMDYANRGPELSGLPCSPFTLAMCYLKTKLPAANCPSMEVLLAASAAVNAAGLGSAHGERAASGGGDGLVHRSPSQRGLATARIGDAVTVVGNRAEAASASEAAADGGGGCEPEVAMLDAAAEAPVAVAVMEGTVAGDSAGAAGGSGAGPAPDVVMLDAAGALLVAPADEDGTGAAAGGSGAECTPDTVMVDAAAGAAEPALAPRRRLRVLRRATQAVPPVPTGPPLEPGAGTTATAAPVVGGQPLVAPVVAAKTVFFLPEHPQASTHGLVRRAQPAIVQFIGALPRRPAANAENPADVDLWFAFVLGLFKSYRGQPVPAGLTVQQAYEEWWASLDASQEGKAYKAIVARQLDNMEASFATKERARARAVMRRSEQRAAVAAADPDRAARAANMEEDLIPLPPDFEAREDDVADDAGPLYTPEDTASRFDLSTPNGAYAHGVVLRFPNPLVMDGLGVGRPSFVRPANDDDKGCLRRAATKLKNFVPPEDDGSTSASAAPGVAEAPAFLRSSPDLARVRVCVTLVDAPSGEVPVKELPPGQVPPYNKLRTPPTPEETVQLFTLTAGQGVPFLLLARAFLAEQHQEWVERLHILILGGPGTGKSQTMRALLWFVYQHGVPHWLATCAFTWCAVIALNAAGHRGLSTYTMFKLMVGSEQPRLGCQDAVRINLGGGAIALDEISLVSLPHFGGINLSCFVNLVRSPHLQPGDRAYSVLGGKHASLSGDYDQHQPIQRKPLFALSETIRRDPDFVNAAIDKAKRERTDQVALRHTIASESTADRKKRIAANEARKGKDPPVDLDAQGLDCYLAFQDVFLLDQQQRQDQTEAGRQLTRYVKLFGGRFGAAPPPHAELLADVEEMVKALQSCVVDNFAALIPLRVRVVLVRNEPRHALNTHILKAEAQHFGHRLIVWSAQHAMVGGAPLNAVGLAYARRFRDNLVEYFTPDTWYYNGARFVVLDSPCAEAGACHNTTVVACGLLLDERELADPGTGGWWVLRHLPRAVFVRPEQADTDLTVLAGIADYSESHGAFAVVPRWSSPAKVTLPDPMDLGGGMKTVIQIKRKNVPLGDGSVITDFSCQGATFGPDDCRVVDLLAPPPGPAGGHKRAAVYILLSRFRSMRHIKLLRPLYEEGNEASFNACVKEFVTAATSLLPSLKCEQQRLSVLAAATRVRYKDEFALMERLIASRR